MKRRLFVSVGLILSFALWTVLVRFVDVRAIGPMGSGVGFGAVNGWFHGLTGVHMWLYTVTDWLGLVPIVFCLGFALLGLVQWIRRKRIWRVDHSILVLGGYFLVVMAVYILFEYVVINRRPVLIGGFLEASYPSSTTLLVLCVMPPCVMQLNGRIRRKWLRNCVIAVLGAFTVFMVVGRLLSGVHWLTDILGGILLSAGLVMGYRAIC